MIDKNYTHRVNFAIIPLKNFWYKMRTRFHLYTHRRGLTTPRLVWSPPLCDLYIFIQKFHDNKIDILYIGQSSLATRYPPGNRGAVKGACGRAYSHLYTSKGKGTNASNIGLYLWENDQHWEDCFVVFLHSATFHDPENAEKNLIKALDPIFNRAAGNKISTESKKKSEDMIVAHPFNLCIHKLHGDFDDYTYYSTTGKQIILGHHKVYELYRYKDEARREVIHYKCNRESKISSGINYVFVSRSDGQHKYYQEAYSWEELRHLLSDGWILGTSRYSGIKVYYTRSGKNSRRNPSQVLVFTK